MAEFRFYKEDIHELTDQMQLLDEITSYNCLSQLRYLHYALSKALFKPIPELFIRTNHIMEMIGGTFCSQDTISLLSPQKLLQGCPQYRENTSKTNLTSCCKTPVNSLMSMRNRESAKPMTSSSKKSSIRKLSYKEKNTST